MRSNSQRHDTIDDEAKAGFVSFLCVRTSVYVESSIKTILSAYVEAKTSDIPTRNYVNSNLRNLTPNREQILSLIRTFDVTWAQRLKESTVEYSDSLRAIVVNRNQIAHGEDVVLSLQDLERYFVDAQRVVELVHDECM